MFRLLRAFLVFATLVVLVTGKISAQETDMIATALARHYIAERGEVIISFVLPPGLSPGIISENLSIDNILNDTVTAYTTANGFEWFNRLNIPFTVWPPEMADRPLVSRSMGTDWRQSYPDYPTYVQLMEDFTANYPQICLLREFGVSAGGRKLLAIKISDHAQMAEDEPVIFYTSTMHGDELLGYIMLLRLIEHLLSSYESDNTIQNLVNSTAIWVNPLANPDGTFFLSDSTVNGATRFNANQVDLNRDFPDIRTDAWRNTVRQSETTAMIDFMEDIRPVLSANFHGGAEVVNYPMDTWSRLHADDSWYRALSRAYADTVHHYASPGYMTFKENGITNGYAWYPVYGGRQDYNNVLLHGREVTIELSDDKTPPESHIENYWQYNQRSLLQYMQSAFTGITGVVTDSVSGLPVGAEVRLLYHDTDSSYVVSNPAHGRFYRLTDGGEYLLQVKAPGYVTQIRQVQVTPGSMSAVDIALVPFASTGLFPNPFGSELFISIDKPGDELETEVFDIAGRKVTQLNQTVQQAGLQLLQLGRLAPGTYIIRLYYQGKKHQQVVIKTAVSR
ncbi:MAG: T9SS type A sorting domain-containing protein [Bacteroidales bacterium]|nr:T9SS type A sorting domain-containing protein [Bacteroidales bacterium]